MFSWWMPPEISPGVHRPLSQVRYAAQRGWKVNVFSGPDPDTPSRAGEEMAARLPDKLRLHRLPRVSLPVSSRLFPRIHRTAFPDALRLAHAALATRELDPSVVVASGPPFSTFIAAYYAARHFKVPLVLDYRDVWSQCAYGWYSHTRGDHIWDKRIFSSADAAIFTTPSQLEKTVSAHGLRPPLCTVIENGWDEEDFEALQLMERPSDQISTISFIGHLAGHPAILSFLALAQRILSRRPDLAARVQFQFVGAADERLHHALAHHACAPNISRRPHVPKLEALALMKASAALLIAGDERLSIYVPGKLYDYLASRRPVLFYGPDEGEVPRILRSLHAGWIVAPHSERQLEAALDEIVNGNRPDLSGGDVDHWLRDRSRSALAHAFFCAVEDVLARAQAKGRPRRSARGANGTMG
jgi:glycosyltransferase involved in cell wall biosynthesis